MEMAFIIILIISAAVFAVLCLALAHILGGYPLPSRPWRAALWTLLDLLLGIVCAFGAPLIVTLVLGLPFSLDSPFTGYHVLAMFGGIGAYWLARNNVIGEWRRRRAGKTRRAREARRETRE